MYALGSKDQRWYGTWLLRNIVGELLVVQNKVQYIYLPYVSLVYDTDVLSSPYERARDYMKALPSLLDVSRGHCILGRLP